MVMWMGKIKKYIFDLTMIVPILLVFEFRYEICFIFIIIIYAFLLTNYLYRQNNYFLKIRYNTLNEFKISELKFIVEKSLGISVFLTLALTIINLCSENYLPYSNLGIFFLYFAFFFTVSNFIAAYKSYIKKTIAILIVVLISTYIVNPITLFAQILVNNYYWMESSKIIFSCIIWGLLSLVSMVVNYFLIKE